MKNAKEQLEILQDEYTLHDSENEAIEYLKKCIEIVERDAKIKDIQADCNRMGIVTRASPKEYMVQLELFMRVVAKKLKCLPAYADPAPDKGNKHIIKKLDELNVKEELDACGYAYHAIRSFECPPTNYHLKRGHDALGKVLDKHNKI